MDFKIELDIRSQDKTNNEELLSIIKKNLNKFIIEPDQLPEPYRSIIGKILFLKSKEFNMPKTFSSL